MRLVVPELNVSSTSVVLALTIHVSAKLNSQLIFKITPAKCSAISLLRCRHAVAARMRVDHLVADK